MEKLKIAIPGTRGIPNHYGGFEQLAEHLAAGLAAKGHKITVYNSHTHPYKEKHWNGVQIIHRYDPENFMGAAGQFIYDLNCIRHAAWQDYHIIFFPGYTSNTVWGKIFPRKPVIISHMDGLEWSRSKYSFATRRFLKLAEKLATRYSDYFIADSRAIQSYLREKFSIVSEYIPYGATTFEDADPGILNEFQLSPGQYFMLMARMEPENNIEMILQGFHESVTNKKFIVIGNTKNGYGKKMIQKFSDDNRIFFAGSIFQPHILHSLKYHAALYFHGHSAGGTNPSLLEAMASRVLIAAHNNPFNREVLGETGIYFSSAEECRHLIEVLPGCELKEKMIRQNFEKARNEFNWTKVIDHYETYFLQCHEKGKP